MKNEKIKKEEETPTEKAPARVPNDPNTPETEIDEPKKKIVPQVVSP